MLTPIYSVQTRSKRQRLLTLKRAFWAESRTFQTAMTQRSDSTTCNPLPVSVMWPTGMSDLAVVAVLVLWWKPILVSIRELVVLAVLLEAVMISGLNEEDDTRSSISAGQLWAGSLCSQFQVKSVSTPSVPATSVLLGSL